MSKTDTIYTLTRLVQKTQKLSFSEAYDIVRELFWTIADTKQWMLEQGASTKEIQKEVRSIFQDYTGLSADGWVEHLFS